MTAEIPDRLRALRRRIHEEGDVFRLGPDLVAVFDPEIAAEINAINFRDQDVPDPLGDLLAGRQGAVSWKGIRAVWAPAMRRLCGPEATAQLHARMDAELARHCGSRLDFAQLAQQVCTGALLPAVIDGLSDRDSQRLRQDVDQATADLCAVTPPRHTRWMSLRASMIEVRSGFIVRRELRRRHLRRRPRQGDLADPLVELLPAIGYGRAVDAVTALLTAISGPPGAAAACLIHALVSYPQQASRIATELAGMQPPQLHQHARTAPHTSRFIRETLRMWSPPLLLVRPARTPIATTRIQLRPGERYLLSPYLLHHHPRLWTDPDRFDPDRWLAGGEPRSRSPYVPFGFPPKVCVGAGLGSIQLALLCQLLTTRYRIELDRSADLSPIALGAVAVPVGLTGTLTDRTACSARPQAAYS